MTYVAETVFPKYSIKIDEFENRCAVQVMKKLKTVMWINIDNSIDVFNREDLVCMFYRWRRYLFKKLNNMDRLTNDMLLIDIKRHESDDSYIITAQTGNDLNEIYSKTIKTNNLTKDVKEIIKEIIDIYVVDKSI